MIGYLVQDYSLVRAFAAAAVADLDTPAEPASGRRRSSSSRTSPGNPGSAPPFSPSQRALQMAPSLSDLFGDGEILASRGPLDRPASGIVMDSRRVVPGNVFFALPGLRTDGSTHVAEALSRGAIAIVSNAAILYEPPLLAVSYLAMRVPSLRQEPTATPYASPQLSL